MGNKEIVFMILVMRGGGAERVLSLLANELVRQGYKVTIIITHQKKSDAMLDFVDKSINIVSLEDEVVENKDFTKKLLLYKLLLKKKIKQLFGKHNDEDFLVEKYEIQRYERIGFLKDYFSKHNNSTVVSFLNTSIFFSLLSVTENNKLIISERGDPRQSLDSKTNVAFFNRMFNKADMMVFQSPDAKEWFLKNAGVDGKVIFNPIKADLPDRFEGERQKTVVNFCRFDPQKNLPLLIEAFEKFSRDFPDYTLKIYGDGPQKDMLLKLIKEKELSDKVFLEDFSKNIHEKIKDAGMFVSSSDFEGMSNSMLEAMGMGIPSICTDCPAGGAKAIIKDHENGILVPLRDADSMYKAMKEVAEDKDLAEKLSINGTKLREELALDKIISQWMEIIK